MKKSSTRTVLFSLLISASIGSYIYLNSLSSPMVSFDQAAGVEEYEEDIESNDAEIILPDVHLIKKVIETGKRLIPAS
ncbi:MAG: hypothetical protein H6573_18025 [Lewinellaceae bacterium]|nr:hypothetical protein [Phaeodactylibacter sp.]MCB9349389.1 hypothetical protein [Lewinellaceae bacterium]